ncbi:MAG: DUF4382 domain-containing protein [Gemmatimonadetes bacterium]|nr:DUF4382 domain-containing protein [Gemmatimonadota bacterium]
MLPLVVIAMAGCDDIGLGPQGEVPLTLSFAVEPRAGLAGAADGGLSLASTAETLTLSAVSLHVEELVLERAEGDANVDSDGDSEADSDSDGGANEKFEVEGAIIDLPLEGGVITPLSQPVPAGRYEEIEVDIQAVRLVGTVDGEGFDVLVPVDLELEMDFEPPIEVSGDETFNITISIDPLAWLENPDGTFIDPRDLATDGSLMNLVRQRMALSFDAFEDSDHDADSEDSDSDSG